MKLPKLQTITLVFFIVNLTILLWLSLLGIIKGDEVFIAGVVFVAGCVASGLAHI